MPLKMSLKECTLDFAKNILGVKRNSPSLATLGNLRSFSVTLNFICRMITYWHRLVTLEDDSLLQKAYNEILKIPDDLSDWKSTIKYILKLLGLESLIDRPSSFSTAQVKRKVKDKLRSTFIHQWEKQVKLA